MDIMDSNNNLANMELEPGMICLVISAKLNTKNIGKIVTLVRYLNGEEFIPELEGFAAIDSWLIEGESLVAITTTGMIDEGKLSIAGRMDLMPIRPEEDPLEITDTIIKKEKA